METKIIAHIDMDAFFASIEQAVNPRLKGRPVIVGGRNNRNKTVVCAASYEAKAYGIDSGMPAFMAFKLCPQVEFVVADTAKYLWTSEKILEILKEFSPQVEMASVDEFVMDLTGCDKFFGSIENIANLIKKRIKDDFNITCSIGIAPNRLMAKLASKAKKPDGLFILEEKDLHNFLNNLPVEKICGIGPNIKSALNSMGIFTCGRLAEFPIDLLVFRFGKIGLWLSEAAKGRDIDYVEFFDKKEELPKSVGHSYTLERTVKGKQKICSWLRLLAEMVGARLRKLELEGFTQHIWISHSIGFGFSKQRTFKTPTCDGLEIYQRIFYIVPDYILSKMQVRAVGISLSNLTPHCYETFLLPFQAKRHNLLKAVDKINARFNDWTIFPASLTKP